MRAVGVTEWGGPDVLQVLDLPTPEAGPGQVRIRVYAAAVNPTDTLLRDGSRAEALRDVPPPFVLGMDAAGELDQIGPDVETSLQVGDPVMAVVLPAGAHGAYAEQIVVPAESVVRAPQGASHAEAASLLMNAVTVRAALDALDLQPGQLLAVTGAAGAVGGFAVELGKADGLRVVADASPADEKLVTSLGARVREVFPEGADGLVDGALLDEHALAAVRDGGRIATVRGYQGPDADERGITFHPVFVRDYAREQTMLDRLRQQAEQGQVTLRVAQVFPAGQAAEAHRILEAGGTRGRLVLEF
jgi:NADPH2:quinone reductase